MHHKTQEFVPQVLKQVVNRSCFVCHRAHTHISISFKTKEQHNVYTQTGLTFFESVFTKKVFCSKMIRMQLKYTKNKTSNHLFNKVVYQKENFFKCVSTYFQNINYVEVEFVWQISYSLRMVQVQEVFNGKIDFSQTWANCHKNISAFSILPVLRW